MKKNNSESIKKLSIPVDEIGKFMSVLPTKEEDRKEIYGIMKGFKIARELEHDIKDRG